MSLLKESYSMADEKAEEDSYSVIFSSLRHPIRRRILRMLKEKPLTFSEILASLSIDSGHLSYHLETLGDLITRTADEKYQLSTIGVAAVRLMGGVEEHELHPPAFPRLKLGHIIETLYPMVLVVALLVVSVYFLTFTTQQFSIGMGGDSWFPTAPIAIAPGQTFTFNITVQYNLGQGIQWYGINLENATTIQITVNVTNGGETVTVPGVEFQSGTSGPFTAPIMGESGFGTYNYTFQRSVPTITPDVWETGFLKFGITTNQTSGPVTQSGNYVIVLSAVVPPDVQVIVHKPDGTVAQTSGVSDWDYSQQKGVFGLTSISTEGTYTFEIKNNGTKELDAFLRPIAEWQLEQKPYFYYGIAGLVISAVYPIVILVKVVNAKLSKTSTPKRT